MIQIKDYFDKVTGTFSYIVIDDDSQECAIIDPVLDYDPSSASITTTHADLLCQAVQSLGGQLKWILETHAHADHLSAAHYIQSKLGGKIGIGEHIQTVQKGFSSLLNLGGAFPIDGSQFDQLFADGDAISLGNSRFEVMHTPGHTPACVSYKIENNVFVGDTILRPDFGTARADFPGGDAIQLFQSIRRILAVGDNVVLYLCHDYPKAGHAPKVSTTVAEQKQNNIMIHEGISEAEYVALRKKRDSQLPVPKLIWPALQVNIRAGALPTAEDNGTQYLKIPLNQLGD